MIDPRILFIAMSDFREVLRPNVLEGGLDSAGQFVALWQRSAASYTAQEEFC